jgi:putative drug exporter of the RND superfamily
LAIVPLVVAVISITTTFLPRVGADGDHVRLLARRIPDRALVGLSVAIDYTVLIVVGWREERAAAIGGMRRSSAR